MFGRPTRRGQDIANCGARQGIPAGRSIAPAPTLLGPGAFQACILSHGKLNTIEHCIGALS